MLQTTTELEGAQTQWTPDRPSDASGPMTEGCSVGEDYVVSGGPVTQPRACRPAAGSCGFYAGPGHQSRTPTLPQPLNLEGDATICSRRICIGTSWSACRLRKFRRAPPSLPCSPY